MKKKLQVIHCPQKTSIELEMETIRPSLLSHSSLTLKLLHYLLVEICYYVS